VPMALPPSRLSRDQNLKDRVRRLERQVAELAKQQAAAAVVGDGWERPGARSRRVGDSVRTIERQVLAGKLQKRVDGRRVYVRDPPNESAKKSRGRPPKADTSIAPPVAITDQTGPQFPFRAEKEPP
jgi:hypothetical protein